MKKFQVALDLLSIDHALEVLEAVGEYIDVIELGTPLIIKEGSGIIPIVKEKYPDKLVFADIKVMDGGSVVPRIAFEAGADMVSVLAVADDSTIEATLECAEEYGKDVLVDMCSVIDMEQRAKEVDAMGPTYICVHVGYDIQDTGVDPIEELKKIEFVNTAKAIAGGIKLANFEEAVKSPADLVIVGGGLYKQNDMHAVAKQMRAIVDRIKTERGS